MSGGALVGALLSDDQNVWVSQTANLQHLSNSHSSRLQEFDQNASSEFVAGPTPQQRIMDLVRIDQGTRSINILQYQPRVRLKSSDEVVNELTLSILRNVVQNVIQEDHVATPQQATEDCPVEIMQNVWDRASSQDLGSLFNQFRVYFETDQLRWFPKTCDELQKLSTSTSHISNTVPGLNFIEQEI
jgi:hypothetical protein